MEKERAVNKMMFWLREGEEIPEKYLSTIRAYLKMAYMVGYDERGKELSAHNKKTVVQYTRDGVKLNEFPSVEEASRRLKVGVQGLYSAIERGSITKRGHIWKYKVNGAHQDSN